MRNISIKVAPEILNAAMKLSLEFGPAWRKPITARLRGRFPHLSDETLAEIDRFAREARDWAENLIMASLLHRPPAEAEAKAEIQRQLIWIDQSTFEELWNQGVYFAKK
jgi:hypothetical protein